MQSASRLAGLVFLCAALPAAAAQLDAVADAALGKPSLTAPADPVGSATNIESPSGVAEDPVTGELWVADTGAHRVLRFASASGFASGEAANLVLGQADFTGSAANRGGSRGAGTLNTPHAIAVDQAGNVYVSDYLNHRVLVFRPPFANGMDAAFVIGQADFTSGAANRGGGVASDTLRYPTGLAIDPRRGDLWVADQYNNRVLTFPAPPRAGVTAYRVLGQPDLNSSAAATTATGMDKPRAIAFDSSDNLWVADGGNNRVLRYDYSAGNYDGQADLVLCQAVFTTAASGTAASTCSLPGGIAVEQGGAAVYVADILNSRILRFTNQTNGALATLAIGQASLSATTCNRGGAPGASTLCTPVSLAMARNGDLLATDQDNGRLLRYDLPRARTAPLIDSLSPRLVPQGGDAFTLTVNGSRFHSNSVVNWNGAPLATQFLSDRRLVAQVPAANIATVGPYAVTVTTPGPGGGSSALLNVSTYVRAPLDGVADRVLGQPDFDARVANNPAVGEERLGNHNLSVLPASTARAAVDPVTGRLFVVVGGANRVLSWPDAQAFRNAQPADVVIGQPDGFGSGCNNGGVSAASLCAPHSVAVDPAGSLYVSDYSNNRVLKYAPPFATGMAASRVFGQGGQFTTGVANNGGVGANSLNNPEGVAATADRLFVYDRATCRILVYDNPDADFTADVVIGQAGMGSAGSLPVSATSVGCSGGAMAVGPDGRLYLSVILDNRVVRFSPPFTNGMAADLVLGQPDFTSSSLLPASAWSLSGPIGVAFDPAGNLLVAEFGRHRVVRFSAPFANGMAASHVLGQPDFATETSGTSASKLWYPSGIAVDGVGNVYVPDASNARLLAFDRPFAFALDPATDLDRDGIPNGVEATESRDPYKKDNDVFGNARLFAMQQYRDFLGREGDAAGIQGWADLVTAGTYTRPQVIDAFVQSAEFGGFVAPVVRLYFATFLRVPDYAGLTGNAALVRNGTVTLTQLADFFVASPEFQATYGALTNTQFVTLLYNNVLQRAPDQAGLDGWVALLDGGMSRGQVLLGFSDSAEYQAAMASEVLVTMMYAAMLRRSPEPAGFNGWVGFLDAATYTREQVINGFFLSTEYRGRFLP